MTIEIHHVKDPVFMVDESDFNTGVDYMVQHPTEKVAEIDTDDLDKAFYLTNNIDSGWINNDRVTAESHVINKGGCRSSSVGDVFILATTEGKPISAHVVMPCGFRELADLNWS